MDEEDERETDFLSDLDGTLIQTYNNWEPIPGVLEFMPLFGRATIAVTLETEKGLQEKKLQTLERLERGVRFKSKLIVYQPEDKARTLKGFVQRVAHLRHRPLICIGNRPKFDIRPVREAEQLVGGIGKVLAIRIRHKSDIHYNEEAKDALEEAHHTFDDFYGVLGLLQSLGFYY